MKRFAVLATIALLSPLLQAAPAQAAPDQVDAWGGCTLTVAKPERLQLYIHAWATLHCKGNVTPSSILIDLGYGSHSVQRKWYDVPANVNENFGMLYTCPGGTGGTSRKWAMDAIGYIKYPYQGHVLFAEYDVVGPGATFRC
ncbi:MAG: hypothetical protein QOH03_5301 [Kribbellaceae bacterium]|jgi:hypothetical protein|nr:hypothetical protein [Kribbellaceae bacterium]